MTDKYHFMPIQFMKPGDVFETQYGHTFKVVQVFGREPIYHRYFYAVTNLVTGLRSMWNNTSSRNVKRVYRNGYLVWITIGDGR